MWYKNAVFYEVNVRAFADGNGDGHGDLIGLTQRLDYLKDLGVDCLWLMPIFQSPLRDDGYDISDYFTIQPTFGTVADFKHLLDEAHKRGMKVLTDLVMNHTSDQHPWFQAARSSRNSTYRDYYVWSDTDEKYPDARIIFLDTEKSNWTWDEQAGQFFWHRFYSSQPDLNFDNPAVRQAILDALKFWMDLGIDGFRADAIPYLFEREGTICENLPETHAYLKEIRQYIDKHYPGTILLAEANQWPEDVRPYFGDGDEFHMGFHFPVMPRIYMALRKQSKEDLVWILNRTPQIPENCQWCTFLRNHDELTLEMVTPEEREWMWQEYAPQPRMRLNLGIRRRFAPLLDNDPARMRLAYGLLFSLPGSPIIYYGDEIGMGDNIDLFDRNGVRTPMQWEDEVNAGFSTAQPEKLYTPVIESSEYGKHKVNVSRQLADPHSLLNAVKHLLAVRKSRPEMGWGSFAWIETRDPAVIACRRDWQGQTLVAVSNLSESEKDVRLEIPSVGAWKDLLADGHWQTEGTHLHFHLSGSGFLWLAME
jgi:maltose alpha-D-glucosyltransferase / alpha-amylase